MTNSSLEMAINGVNDLPNVLSTPGGISPLR